MRFIQNILDFYNGLTISLPYKGPFSTTKKKITIKNDEENDECERLFSSTNPTSADALSTNDQTTSTTSSSSVTSKNEKRCRYVIIACCIASVLMFVSYFSTQTDALNHGEVSQTWAQIGSYLYRRSEIELKILSTWNVKSYNFDEKMKISQDISNQWKVDQCNVIKDSFMLFAMRVPKAASTTLEEIVDKLSGKNKFIVSKLASLTPVNSEDYGMVERARDFCQYFASISKRFVNVAHLKYMDFRAFQLPSPAFVGTLREPIARIVSHYNYDAFGDRPMHPHHERTFLRVDGNGTVQLQKTNVVDTTLSFVDCVEQSMLVNQKNITQEGVVKYTTLKRQCLDYKYINTQLRYYCGQSDPRCKLSDPNNDEQLTVGLNLALQNVQEKFASILVVEDMVNSIALTEKVLPSFFKGALELYEKSGEMHSNSNNRTDRGSSHNGSGQQSSGNKHGLSPEMKEFLDYVLRYEIIFYEKVKKLIKERMKQCGIDKE